MSNPNAGSVFDDDSSIFEENEDDEDQEGSFRDKQSSFDTAHNAPEDHRNPLTTRLQEEEQWETPHDKAPVISKQLVVRFDANSRPFVAKHENGKAIERYRPPTQAEHEKIRTKAKLVRGGVGEVTPAAAVSSPGLFGVPWTKLALYGGGAAVVGLGGWWLWKNHKRKNGDADADVDVVDD